MVAWTSHVGPLDPGGTWLAFLEAGWIRWGLSVAALGELVADKLPGVPSRTILPSFGLRLVSGSLCGAAVGASAGTGGAVPGGLVAGAVGAALGTFGGHAFRARLASALGSDPSAALLEDALAIAGALLVVVALPSAA